MAIMHEAPTHVRRPRVNLWLVAVIALAAALIALGAWVLVDRNTSSSAPGRASPEVATMLADRIAAMNREDGPAAAVFYTKDAIMQEEDNAIVQQEGPPGLVTKGRKQIAARLQFLSEAGLRIERVGAPIQMGRFVGEAVRFYEFGGSGTGEGVLVFELDKSSGKIAHQWVTGDVRD